MSGVFDEFSAFRIDQNAQESPDWKFPFKKIEGAFIGGPIPAKWLVCALDLKKGQAPIRTALAIWRLHIMKNRRRQWRFKSTSEPQKPIELTTKASEIFGVNRHAKYRALKLLEKAGLITVSKQKGKNPSIMVIEDGPRPDADVTTSVHMN